MMNVNSETNRTNNPSGLADQAVYALSSIIRDAQVSLEMLNKGVILCDYFITILDESELPDNEKSQLTFRASREDVEELKNKEIDISKIQEVKKLITDLMDNPKSHTPEEIRDVQQFLVITTMPMWQKRTIEFREKKLRKGLLVRG
jgi:hypothetical protein